MNGKILIEAITDLRKHCNNSYCSECIFMDLDNMGCIFHNKPYDIFLTEKMTDYLEECE